MIVLLWRSEVPADLRLPDLDPEAFFSDQELRRAADYERFVRINFLLSQAVLILALAVYAVRGARFARESAAGRIGTGMLLAMVGLAVVWLTQLPFGAAELWWERRHDLSELGYLEWIVFNWLTLAGEFLFICLAILIVMALAGLFRNRWWAAAAPAFVALGLFFAFVYPYLIPELKPVKQPGIAADAERLARVEGVPGVEVDVQEVKELTSAPNAEAAGLGPTRRVILWDTLLDGRFSRDEIGFVIAHEFAHHAREHIWKGITWYALFALPGTFLIALLTRRRGGLYHPAAVPLSLLVYVGLSLLAQPIQNVVTRRMEAEADWGALQATRDPDAARTLFKHFGTTTLQQPDPPAWAYLLLDSHPTIMQRLAMAEAWAARR